MNHQQFMTHRIPPSLAGGWRCTGANALMLTCLFGLAEAPLQAQQTRIPFRHLTISDGLSQNAATAVIQGREGFMWIGTKDGLNRYDGYKFTTFRHDPFDSTSISDNEITTLFEDSRGRLWVGTWGDGLNRFDRESEVFHRYPDGPRRVITSIDEDLDGNLWIGTENDGLYQLVVNQRDGQTHQFVRFRHDTNDPRSLSNDEVNAVVVDKRGTLWVGTERGLDRLNLTDPDRTGFIRYAAGPAQDGLIDQRITALHEDDQGRLWMGSLPGLSVFDANRERTTHYYHRYRTVRYGWGEAIQLLADRAGRVWMSTHSELMLFDPESSSFRYFRHDPLDPEGINSDVPTALYEDRAGVIWIGTNGYGLNIHDPKALRFKTFRRPEDRAYRQTGFSVYTLFEDSNQRVWVDAGLLYRWDRSTDGFLSFETDAERLDDFGNTGVWEITEEPTGTLWVAAYQGLYRYEIATGQYRLYKHDPNDPNGLPENEVRHVFSDRNGTLWVVTENYLAQFTDTTTGRFTSYAYKPRTTSRQWTFPSPYEDANGNFWLGSSQGLVRFDIAAETFQHYSHDPGNPSTLSHNDVRSISEDPNEPENFLWIGTAGGGLNRFDFETEAFVHFTVNEGLPNNVIYGILPDDAGNLWLSTNLGLSRFDPRTLRARNYDVNDGLQSNEYNSGAYFKSPSGELFFGGIYGFNYFHPDDIKDNPHVPDVVITGFKRGNSYESVRDSGTVLSKTISHAESIQLSYRDNVITFEFAALDYSAPAKNRYAYRMVGFNDEWIESGDVRSATYTNLPHGSYTFEVRGSNNDEVWNATGASLAITIVPPWWRTWWAYTFYALLAVATLFSGWRYQLSRIRLKNRLALEHVEAEQARELTRARSRSFANLSHEFRTPLTLTLGPLDDVRSGLHGPLTEGMKEQVDLARRNATRVLDLINQILDVSRLENGSTPLRARRLDLCTFVSNAARVFMPLAERKTVTFAVQVPPEAVMLYADPVHLEKILSNLLSNALKFTPPGGAVRVTVHADVETVRLAVRDSGPGISSEELDRVFERFYRVDMSSKGIPPGTGIGLALAKELVDLHGGTILAESEEGFGSTFTVSLKLGKSHLAPDQIDDADAPIVRPSISLAGQLEDTDWAMEGPDVEEQADADADRTTVLVVEDNAELRAYVRTHLAPIYQVLEAANGKQGLDIARRLLPDLVLSDVMMPGDIDGYALCRALKENPETDFIPVVLLTAKAETEDRLAGLHEHADDYITKPFNLKELLARIENLIGMRKLLRERVGDAHVGLHAGVVDVAPVDEQFLDRVRAAIEEHLSDETFGVEQLAREVAHSRGHLHRRLRGLLEESPSNLIRRMRLERAAQLLETRAGSVGEIAYAVGFKSVAHFSNRFNEQFGVRPSAYKADETGETSGDTSSTG